MNWSWTTTKLLAGVVILLLGSGALHRWVRLSRVSAASVYRPLCVSLSNLPSHLGPYVHKRDLPLSAEVLQVAGVDSFVHGEYVDPVAGELVQLYVGYWGHENLGMGHGPEVCYPAAGWQIDGAAKQRVLQLPGANGVTDEAVIGIHHFTRTEPQGIEQQAVGFLAVVDGQFHATSRGMFMHRPPSSQDEGFLAHILVSTPVMGTDWPAADTRIVNFMGRLLPHVSRCLFGSTRGSSAQGSDESGAPEQTGRTHDGNE